MKRLVLIKVSVDQIFDEFIGYPLITTGDLEGNHVKIGITETDGFGDIEFTSVDELIERVENGENIGIIDEDGRAAVMILSLIHI